MYALECWSVAVGVFSLKEGIAAGIFPLIFRSFGGSHARSLLVGIFALIVGSFVW